MQRRSWSVVLFLTGALTLPAFSFGAGGIVVPGNGGGRYGNNNNNNKNQNKDKEYQTLRFVQSKEVTLSGKQQTAVMLTQLNGSGQIIAIVQPDDPRKPEAKNLDATAAALKKGDVVSVGFGMMGSYKEITYLKHIDVNPAEENPHGFVYEEFYNAQGSGAPIVRLQKYGESIEVTLPMVKDDKGKMDYDPQMVDQVQKYKKGEPVYVQLIRGSREPVATLMIPYKDPQNGKVVKESDQVVDGGKTPAVDIDVDGKTVTALVPGKMNGKHFVPDPVLARDARNFKPGTEVTFLTREDNGKTYLVEYTKTPKTSAAKTGAAGENMANSR